MMTCGGPRRHRIMRGEGRDDGVVLVQRRLHPAGLRQDQLARPVDMNPGGIGQRAQAGESR